MPAQTNVPGCGRRCPRGKLGTGVGNNVAAFIIKAMAPVRYSAHPDEFERRRGGLNVPLGFVGLQLQPDGTLAHRTVSRTLNDARNRERELRRLLAARGVHPDVLDACRAELLVDNYFHAVLEAVKSLAEKLRQRTGIDQDGSGLVDSAFLAGLSGGALPPLAFNSLQTETHRGEQRGIAGMMKGVFSTFRNPTAHEPKNKWPINETDALDILTMVSYLHRRVDAAVSTTP